MENNFETILKNNTFVGIVEDNQDPDKKMRLKIRVPYLHGSKEQIPTDNLPWSSPKKINDIIYNLPSINKIINVTFPTGELLFPQWENVEHLDVNLQKKIESLSDNDYTKFISLCYNHNTQIFISNDEGLNLYHKKSGFQVKDNGDVVTRLNGNGTNYYIGDDNASQSAMLGNHFIAFMDKLMNTLPNAYIDSMTVPCIPQPALLQLILEYQTLRKTFLSNNVYISDNNTISRNNINTERQIGDNFETIKENKDLNIKIRELEVAEVKQELQKEQDKLLKNGTKTDEVINNEDGLLARQNINDLNQHVEELKNTKTETVEINEIEPTHEASNIEEDNYWTDFYNDDNQQSDVINISGPTADDYWEPEYFYPPKAEESKNVGGIIKSGGTRSGRQSMRQFVPTNKEELNFNILPAPNMISSFMSYNKAIFSSTAKKMNIENTPDNNAHLRNLVSVFSTYWDITFKFFKEKLGYILILNSAYRNFEVNKAVGGSTTSQHKTGSALDIILTPDGNASLDNRKNNLLFYFLKHRFDNFGQLIWEDNAGDGPRWCHISLNNAGRTGQILQLVGGVIKEPNEETVRILKQYGIWDDSKEDKIYNV